MTYVSLSQTSYKINIYLPCQGPKALMLARFYTKYISQLFEMSCVNYISFQVRQVPFCSR